MKKVYQEIIMEFWVDDDVDIDEVLFEMDVDIKDTTGKIEDGDIDWEYRHLMVEERQTTSELEVAQGMGRDGLSWKVPSGSL